MHAARSTGFRAFALATVAGLTLSGVAVAQPKPAPQGAPTRPALPTAKPPPLGAPQQAQPAMPPRPAPPVVQAPAPAPPPAIAAPQVIPPNEPAAVTRLRGLLGANVTLTYTRAESLDAAGEQVRLTGVAVAQPGKRATADEVVITGLRPDGVAEAVIRGFVSDDPGGNVSIGMIRLAGLTIQRDAPGVPPQPEQVRLDSLRVENVASTGPVAFRLGLVELEGWAAGQPARLAIQGFESQDVGDAMVRGVRIARLATSGMDFARSLGAVIRGDRVPSLVGRATFEMTGLDLLGTGTSSVGGVAETRIEADVARADGSGTGTIAMRGIRVAPVAAFGEWLTRFGYQDVQGDITARTIHDATTGRIEIQDLTIGARDVGTLTFSLTMDGLTAERVQVQDFSQARLIGAALGYADASLFRRFIAMQATQTRTPEAQLREQYAAMAGGALSQPGAAALDPIRDAVLSFIRGQAQSVQILVNPPQPIGMAEMQQVPPSPAEMQRVLGISATAR